MILKWENSLIRVAISVEPFFSVTEFTDRKSGMNLFTTGTPFLTADRKQCSAFRFLSSVRRSDTEYELVWKIDDITLTRHLFFYRNAPAIRWYDTMVTESDKSAMYYSDLADIHFRSPCTGARVIHFFSCSDQSNRRLIDKEARTGKNVGAYFLANGLCFYKEGPMPDCQPIKGEYDFFFDPAQSRLEMLGLGFDNLRKGEIRRANGVVIGLTGDFGMQRYRLERYAAYPQSAASEVLSNSWPDLQFGVNEEVIMKEIHAAAEAGINCVFIDDGWFSTFMGEIDETKFPNRFHTLAETAKRCGVELGLWCNPLGLDIRHPRMALWDGAECHDTMLEPNPWNWLARTDDYQQTELQGGAGSERSYSPIDLMDDDAFQFMKNKLSGFYREYGIRHFKFDLYQLTAFNTLRGDANLHYEKYRELLEALQREIPELVISMDVTRRNRPNFDFALDFGRLFLENRGRSLKDHRYYHPYMALGNLWYTLKYAPAKQLEIEMMPQIDDYPLEYILGTTIFATPLYWGVIENTPPEKRKQMKCFFAEMAPYRKIFSGYLTTAAGEMPMKGTWSAIISVAPDSSEGFIAVYRNGAETSEHKFELPFGSRIETVRGSTEVHLENGMLNVRLPELYSFALYRFQS